MRGRKRQRKKNARNLLRRSKAMFASVAPHQQIVTLAFNGETARYVVLKPTKLGRLIG